MATTDSGQAEKFKELARELGVDEDEATFDAKLREVAKHKPAPEKPDPSKASRS